MAMLEQGRGEALVATLIEHRPPLDGDVREIRRTEGGAAVVVEFPAPARPELRIAERATLRVTGQGHRTNLIVGVVVSRSRSEGVYSSVFLVDADAREALLSKAFRREAFRVRPSEASPVHGHLAELGGAGRAHDVIVDDISVTGASLLVPHALEDELGGDWDFKLVLQLPTTEDPIELVVEVASRRLSGSAYCYGVRFDQHATDSFERLQGLILRYVMLRQRETLRVRRTREGT
jgi:hypothetical protein